MLVFFARCRIVDLLIFFITLAGTRTGWHERKCKLTGSMSTGVQRESNYATLASFGVAFSLLSVCLCTFSSYQLVKAKRQPSKNNENVIFQGVGLGSFVSLLLRRMVYFHFLGILFLCDNFLISSLRPFKKSKERFRGKRAVGKHNSPMVCLYLVSRCPYMLHSASYLLLRLIR